MENCHKVELSYSILLGIARCKFVFVVAFLISKPLTLKWFTYQLIHLSIIAFEN